MKKQQGFTLIELMIVVAIIGILAAIAIPAYQDYTIRAQVSEGLSLAGGAKTAIAEFFQDSGEFPSDNAAAGVSNSNEILGKYVTDVAVTGNTNVNGIITVTYGNDANTNIANETLVLTASPQAGSVQWECTAGSAGMEQRWLPAACRN